MGLVRFVYILKLLKVVYTYHVTDYLLLQRYDWHCLSAADRMASRMRRSEHVKGLGISSTPSPTRKPVSVNDWFESLGLTEYSHLFAAYRSIQVSIWVDIKIGSV